MLSWKDALTGFAAAVVLALMIVAYVGCTTIDGEREFDRCQALQIAQGSHAVAEGASLIVCSAITDPGERAKCMQQRAKYKEAGGLILQFGAALLKACGLTSHYRYARIHQAHRTQHR